MPTSITRCCASACRTASFRPTMECGRRSDSQGERAAGMVRAQDQSGCRPMISLLCEVQPRAGHIDQYLDLAAALKPRLADMGGCLFIDRFKSLTRQNLLLSDQTWQDEGAMTAWRVDPSHHRVQELGRKQVFADYRIRIAQVIHEARPDKPSWRPERRTPYNDPARRPPTYVLASESRRAELPVQTAWHRDAFASVYREEYFAHLIDLPDERSGLEFGPHQFADPTTEYFRIFEV